MEEISQERHSEEHDLSQVPWQTRREAVEQRVRGDLEEELIPAVATGHLTR